MKKENLLLCVFVQLMTGAILGFGIYHNSLFNIAIGVIGVVVSVFTIKTEIKNGREN